MIDDDVLFTRIARPEGLSRLEELHEIIARRPDLEPIPDREMINPFTKQPIIALMAGKALFFKSGESEENFSLEDGKVLTTGIPREICEEIAQSLDAVMHDAEFS